MKDQINTIREALEDLDDQYNSRKWDALAALAQIEAAVGSQEPVLMQDILRGLPIRKAKDVDANCDVVLAADIRCKATDRAAPVAQQQEPVKPCCMNFAAGTNCFSDPRIDCPRLHPVAQQPQAEDGLNKLRDMLQEAVDRLIAAPQQAEAVPPSSLIDPGTVVSFAVDRWLAEVANRPLVNKNRRTLDDTWRQVIRRFGGDPDVLLGPPHDELTAIAQQKGGV